MGKWLNGAQARKREIDGKDTRIAALAAAGAAQIAGQVPVATAEERIAAAEAQIQAVMTEIEKAKNDLSDVQIIKNSLGLEENG